VAGLVGHIRMEAGIATRESSLGTQSLSRDAAGWAKIGPSASRDPVRRS
jgi:hypothetical protein